MIRYTQHENENSLRNYPFAESCVLADEAGAALATDMFVDAVLHPIIRSEAKVELKSIDFSKGGVVTLSCGESELTGSAGADDDTMDLYDSHNRRAGTLVLGDGWKREHDTLRLRTFSGIEFCPAATCPVVYNGVEGFVAPDGSETTRKNVVFEGDECLTPVLEETNAGTVLSFDAIFDPVVATNEGAIRQIVFAAIGKTIFSISDDSDENVLVTTPELDREDICWQAHREDSVSTVADTCEPKPDCPTTNIPTRREEIVVCPSEEGSVNIVADDVLGLKNPLKIGTVSGLQVVPTPENRTGLTIEETMEIGSALQARPVIVGNGVEISIPGLGDV